MSILLLKGRIFVGRHCKNLLLSATALSELEELAAEARSIGASDVLLRIRGLVMVSRQHSYREVAACLGVTSGTVSNWVGYFEHEGLAGLLTRPRTGRPAELSEEEFSLLDDLVDAGAVASGFPNDVWDARRVGLIIQAHFGVRYHPHHVAKLLHTLWFQCPETTTCAGVGGGGGPISLGNGNKTAHCTTSSSLSRDHLF
jgi:transposase